MDTLILSIFAIVFVLSLIEDYTPKWQKILILIIIGIALICISTFKPMTTADAENYENYFYNNDALLVQIITEPTFTYLSRFYLSIGFEITALFLTYALIAITLKLTILWKMTPFVFTSMIVYLGIYYPMHDVVQIRCGAATAFLLWAIIPLAKRQYLMATILLIAATLFHYSSLVFMPIIILGNIKINKFWKYILGVAIPICLLLYFAGFSLFSLIPKNLIEGKLEYYKDRGSSGGMESYIPYKQLTFIAEFALLYIFLFYYDTIEKHCQYAQILIKVLVLGMGCHVLFAEIEVLGHRLHDLFGIFYVLAYAQCLYCIKPRYVVRICLAIFSLVCYLAQMYNDVYFH